MRRYAKIFAVILTIAQLFAVSVSAADGGLGFIDVKESRWSYDNIKWAVDNGYMNGVGDGRFAPAASTSRAMVVTVLWRLSGEKSVPYSTRFKDVKANAWYADAVMWAAQNEIVNGTTPSTFAPNADITREQLAAIFYRYAEFDFVDTDGVAADLSVYKDAKKVSSYAKDAMAWANKIGLVNGVTADTLNPKGNATREQFAAILNRYATCDDFKYRTAYNAPVPQSDFTEKVYPILTDADVYVAVDGDDSNPGTLEKPVATFEGARNRVREIKETKTSGEIVVAFKAGNYGNLKDVTLSAEDAGTAECPIRYTRYGDGEVIFDNGFSLERSEFVPITDAEKTLFPEKAADKIMKLSLDKFFPDGLPDGIQIFGSSAPMWEARFPNKVEGRDIYQQYMTEVLEDSPNVYEPTLKILQPFAKQVDKLTDFKDVKLVGYIMYGWRVDSFYIDSYDPSTKLMNLDKTRLPADFMEAEHGIRTPQMELDEVYISNSHDLLDADGEYWYKKDTNTIYVYNPEETYTIGLGGRFVHFWNTAYVTVEGLTFINNADTAMRADSSPHITLDGVKVSGVTGCFTISGGSDWATVRNCDFGRFTGNCMWINPSNHKTTLESNHIVIDNNYIHDFGLSTSFNNQALADDSIGAVISHNYFKNSPNGAINLGTLSVIEYNVFDNLLTSANDFGVIYTGYAISSSMQNQIRYNLFTNMGTSNAYGCYMDDFSQNQYIYGNVFYECGGCGVVLHNARDQYVYDNFFYDCGLSIAGPGYYDETTGKVMDGILPDGTGWEDLYNRYYNGRINEGEEGYEVWKEAFPYLYAFEPDIEHPEKYTSFFCLWDSIHNNAFLHGSIGGSLETATRFGDVHDNVTITDDSENPYFVDPTHGNYTLKDGVAFFNIPYEKIGRY